MPFWHWAKLKSQRNIKSLIDTLFINPIHTISTPLIYSITNEDAFPVVDYANSVVVNSKIYYFPISPDL
jgi:hypothetical protein